MAKPLTGRTETRPTRMTVDVLRYANRAKVAEALTAQGYEVSRMTVNRWARGGEMPSIAERMILGLFGHHEEAAPGIPERLDEIERWLSAIAVATGVEPILIEDLHGRVGELERARRQPDGSRPTAGAPSQGE